MRILKAMTSHCQQNCPHIDEYFRSCVNLYFTLQSIELSYEPAFRRFIEFQTFQNFLYINLNPFCAFRAIFLSVFDFILLHFPSFFSFFDISPQLSHKRRRGLLSCQLCAKGDIKATAHAWLQSLNNLAIPIHLYEGEVSSRLEFDLN